MTVRVLVLAALAASTVMISTAAPAQVPDLSGQFRCLQGCAGGLVGQPAYVTQNGWDLGLVNAAGLPAHAWIDRPGHIWVRHWDEGAVYSPDGMTIQFDRGTVWQRDLGQWGAAVPGPTAPAAWGNAALGAARRGPARRIAPVPATVRAFDGVWSVEIITERGDCDRAYRYAVRISNGYVANQYGESVSLQGRVAPSGEIRVSVASGGQQASGVGRLSRSTGSGTWSGQGSAGYCAGVWEAARRG